MELRRDTSNREEVTDPKEDKQDGESSEEEDTENENPGDGNTALIFLLGLDELKTLLEEYERLLESEDQRKDLNSAETFKSKLDARKDPFQKLINAAKKLLDNKHFMFSGILEKISVMDLRWENMQGLREEIYNKYLDLTFVYRTAL